MAKVTEAFESVNSTPCIVSRFEDGVICDICPVIDTPDGRMIIIYFSHSAKPDTDDVLALVPDSVRSEYLEYADAWITEQNSHRKVPHYLGHKLLKT